MCYIHACMLLLIITYIRYHHKNDVLHASIAQVLRFAQSKMKRTSRNTTHAIGSCHHPKNREPGVLNSKLDVHGLVLKAAGGLAHVCLYFQ